VKRWPVIALAIINVCIAAIAASPAWAQPVAGPEQVATSAAAELLKQGILGALVVLEGVVIWYLYRQVQMAGAKFLDMAVKQTEVFVEMTRTLKRNEEMIERVLDVVVLKR
jgi:hypothetical protein